MFALVEHADLARPPVGMGLLEPDDLAHHVLAQLLAVRSGTPALFLQPGFAVLQKALAPLVAGFRADAVLPAPLPEVLAVDRLLRKFHFRVHFSGVFPSPEPTSSKLRSRAKVLPMF